MNFLPTQRLLAHPSTTSNPRITCSALSGLLIFLSSALLCIYTIRSFISTIQVTPSPVHWAETARVQAYGICYDGCSDCLDVSSIAKSCHKTASVTVQNVNCDASQMWWWKDEDRYPVECLSAVGELYKADALRNKRFWWKALYLITLLSIPLGYATYRATYFVLVKFDVFGERPRIRRSRGSGGSSSSTPLLASTILMLVLIAQIPSVGAYACVNQHPAHNQLFSSKDDSVYGVVHGWLGNCYDETYSCGETCTSSSAGGGRSCDTLYCERPRTERGPRDYVVGVLGRVRQCGFRTVDTVPGVVEHRIPHPGIEGRWWVKIAVNRFNNTDGVLDPSIKCLYDIGDPTKL